MSLIKKCVDYVDERLGVVELTRAEVTEKQVPTHARWWDHAGLSCFGGLTFVFFMLQVISGIVLLVHYIPHPDHAFQSIVFIENNVSYGWFMRRMHAICANLMCFTVIVHLLKVFFTGAYRKPRELHWVSGFILFLLTLATLFTGYSLPWSQMSFWAATVVTNAMGVIPYVGNFLIEFIRGGENISGATLSRFFAAHIAIPAMMLVFLGAHFMMIRKTGIQEPL